MKNKKYITVGMDSDSLLCTRITLCSRNDYLGNYVQNLGISNTDIALYTSWLYLPWVIKPFWSPFVDLLKPNVGG